MPPHLNIKPLRWYFTVSSARKGSSELNTCLCCSISVTHETEAERHLDISSVILSGKKDCIQ